MTLTLYTVNGTAAAGPYDPAQFPIMVANALIPDGEQKFADKLDGLNTLPLINLWANPYPASTYPMGASVNTGIVNLLGAVLASPVGTPKALAGYSQGAIVTSTFWRDYVLSPAGPAHAYLNDFVAAVTWGNPMRCPGVAYGNDYAGWTKPSGGGISGTNDLLPSQTPSWWYDFANPNGINSGADLYTDSPVALSADGTSIVMDDAAVDEMLIYNCIVTTSFFGTLEGLLKILWRLIEQFTRPWDEIVGLAESIWNGLTFISEGPAAGHYTYDVGPAISYMSSVATQYL
jgi:hypothetical protein